MEATNRTFPGLDVTIRETQEVQLEILLAFDRICKTHNISYQLFAGTLIGAIRHKGFIPWDDDVDVCMLRSEYDKFTKIAQSELGDAYFLQNYTTDPAFQSQYSKIRKNHTLYVENLVQDVDMHQGIFIDVFPYDDVEPIRLSGRVQRRLIHRLKIINYCRVKRVNESEPNLVSRIAKKGTYYLLKAIPKRYLDRLITKVATWSNGKGATEVAELNISTSPSLYQKFKIDKEMFAHSIEWEFEGHYFPVPQAYDAILSKNYGDYLSLPPTHQQEPHHGIVEIAFDTRIKKEKPASFIDG